MSDKFKKPESNPLLNAVDYFNFFGSFVSIFEGIKQCNVKSETEVCLLNPDSLDPQELNKPTFILNKLNTIDVMKKNSYRLGVGAKVSKFMVLAAVKFQGDSFAAMSYVNFEIMKSDIPYIRVGTDYFKVIAKKDRYKSENTLLKPWKKDEIKQDHGKQLLGMIYKFDDFTIYPDNVEYTPVLNNCYNLYAKFSHKFVIDEVNTNDIPVTLGLINHIFGDQWELGLKYMKILYENPRQILPVLALVSTERETGKTTFLNWIQMLFGENTTLINPSDLTSNFNDAYATKNIIMIDETTIDKQHAIEKLKSIATAKTMSVSQKFVSHYSVPFFGKVIFCTNKESDFMRIDQEEIRFWVRKIKLIKGAKNTNIETDLFNEIPKFLKYLIQLPAIDFSKSRMVFTKEEIETESLHIVMEQSKSTLRKEIEMNFDDFFMNNDGIEFIEATAKDIKMQWFALNHKYEMSYIRTVLKEEMKMVCLKNKKYKGFPSQDYQQGNKTGLPYLFKNPYHVKNKVVSKQNDSVDDPNEEMPRFA
jgi:hypothetical protein